MSLSLIILIQQDFIMGNIWVWNSSMLSPNDLKRADIKRKLKARANIGLYRATLVC